VIKKIIVFLFILLLLVGVAFTLLYVYISPIAKYVIEKNSVKWTGRQIRVANINVNALNGSVNITDLKIYERNSKNVFFSCHDIYLKVDLKKILAKIYQVDDIKIDKPEISIIQNGNDFNFDDLLKRFLPRPKTRKEEAPEAPSTLRFYVKNFAITNGNITYNNVPIHNVFSIHSLNFSIPELSWNKPVMNIHTDFKYGTGGDFNIDVVFNRKTFDYNMHLFIDKYDLAQYYAPLNSFLSISSLKGFLTTKLRIYGNFDQAKKLALSGYLQVNDVEINDSTKEKVFALGELALNIDSINIQHNLYSIRNIILHRPFLRFDYYPNGNNIMRMVKYTAPSTPVKDTATGEIRPDYSNIFTLIASSLKLMTVSFLNTRYHTDSVVVNKGTFVYNDYTMNNNFHYTISNINILTDEINSRTKNIHLTSTARLNDTGKMFVVADISTDIKNVFFNFRFKDVRISDFNPYTEYYVGSPFLDGYLDYQNSDSIVSRNLNSQNALHIEGIAVGKKIGNKPVYKVPVKLLVSLLKDEDGNVDLNIPVTGSLDDPNYKIGKLIRHIIGDLLKKTVSSPFKLLAKLFKWNPEDMNHFQFDYQQAQLDDKEFRKLDDVYKVLDKKEDLAVVVTQVTDSVQEKYDIAMFKAKNQYYLETNHMRSDSLLSKRKKRKELRRIDKLSSQDSLFDNYLNQKLHLTGAELIPIPDKCVQLVGDSILTKEVHGLMVNRNAQVIDFLINKKMLSPERIKVIVNSDSLLLQDLPQPEFDVKYTADDDN
jgi:hypothetical protein